MTNKWKIIDSRTGKNISWWGRNGMGQYGSQEAAEKTAHEINMKNPTGSPLPRVVAVPAKGSVLPEFDRVNHGPFEHDVV